MAEMERDELARLHQMRHLENAVMTQYTAGKKVVDYHFERSRKQYNRVMELIAPYIEIAPVVDNSVSLIDVWKRTFGNPEDPEVADMIERTKDMLMKGSSNG